MKKRLSLMLAFILIMQVILPLMTVIVESEFTLKSLAADLYTYDDNGLYWTTEGIGESVLVSGVRLKKLNSKVNTTTLSIPDYVKPLPEDSENSRLAVYRIDSSCFKGIVPYSNITSLYIPKNIEVIGEANETIFDFFKENNPYSVFSQLNGLSRVQVDSKNQYFTSIDGVLFDKYAHTLYFYPFKKNNREYSVPYGVHLINQDAFRNNKNLERVIIPNGTNKIEERAFQDCEKLTEIYIPDSVTEIYENVLANSNDNLKVYCKSTSYAASYATKNYVTSSIDDEAPKGKPTVSYVPSGAIVSLSGITDNNRLGSYPYSYDNGETWKTDKAWKYTETGTVTVKVRDAVGNIATFNVNIEDKNNPGQSLTPDPDTGGTGGGSESNYEIEEPIGDTTIPVINSVTKSTTQWTNGDVTLTVDASDVGWGLAGWPYNYNGTWSPNNTYKVTQNGTVAIKVRDIALNESSVTNVTITNIDKTRPTFTVAGNPTSWTTEAKLTVTGNDGSGSGVAQYSFDGGTTYQNSNTYIVTENGDYVIKVKDKAGNESLPQTITVNKISKTGPKIYYHLDNKYSEIKEFEIWGTSDNTNSIDIEYKLLFFVRKYSTGLGSMGKTNRFDVLL